MFRPMIKYEMKLIPRRIICYSIIPVHSKSPVYSVKMNPLLFLEPSSRHFAISDRPVSSRVESGASRIRCPFRESPEPFPMDKAKWKRRCRVGLERDYRSAETNGQARIMLIVIRSDYFIHKKVFVTYDTLQEGILAYETGPWRRRTWI